MAHLEVSGLDSLIGDLDSLAEQTSQLQADILTAVADKVEPALHRSIATEGLVRTGRLQSSIKRRKTNVGGIPAIRLGPVGEHHRYLPSPGQRGITHAGYVGYIAEYGIKSRGIKGRNWLQKGVARSQTDAFNAADTVHEKYLKNNNL